MNKLTKNELNSILIKNYNIIPIKIEEIDRGTADIFKIETENKKYILKQFVEGRKKDLVEKEINVINYLHEQNIKVPIYTKTVQGNYFIEYNHRIIIVQEFIEGYTVKDNEADYERTMQCSKMLGKLVKALKNFDGLSDEGIIQKSFSKEGLENGIAKMKSFKENIKRDNPYKKEFINDINCKIKIAEEFEKSFDFDIMNKVTICNSHGDYSMQQLIFNNNGEIAVIDFEKAKKLPIVWELMRSYTYIDKNAKNGQINIDILADYLKQFLKYQQLNEYDIKYAPHIYLMQLVTSLFCYKEYNEDYSKYNLLKFAFFRTNVCKYLYCNLNEISDNLYQELFHSVL